MADHSGTDSDRDEARSPSPTATESPLKPVWIAPPLIGLIGGLGVQLQFIGVVAAIVFLPVGVVVAVGLVVATGFLIAWVYGATTGRRKPVASALLAVIPATLQWGPVLGFRPHTYAIAASLLGSLLVGVAVGALSMLALPGRWRIAGAISAAVIGVVMLAPIVVELAG